ncbi:hypothetical protein E2C01_042595 [Portunus trituberculatus]|uniref:Uncharacterized protein n=1 Tax=Portunus trituberculatus TaxID=210409 RepID=A0A5B7FQN1_PORTR|nr:hypothetical protein [Portunus trituberculatus]
MVVLKKKELKEQRLRSSGNEGRRRSLTLAQDSRSPSARYIIITRPGRYVGTVFSWCPLVSSAARDHVKPLGCSKRIRNTPLPLEKKKSLKLTAEIPDPVKDVVAPG